MTKKIGLIISRVTERLVQNLHTVTVDTPFGEVLLYEGDIQGREVVCLNRYGAEQNIPSHKVNFRANIWAFRLMGVRRVVSQNAIGSVNPMLRPGDIVIPHDIIDHTKDGRSLSLFDSEECWVRVDMTEPFCPQLREVFIKSATQLSDRAIPRGVFVCAEGPRFETPSEIRQYHREGGDIIGTPMIPEAVMAREAELCYASIAPVINFGAGLAPHVRHSGPDGIVEQYYAQGLHDLTEDIIIDAILNIPEERSCECGEALCGGFHGKTPQWLVDTSLDRHS